MIIDLIYTNFSREEKYADIFTIASKYPVRLFMGYLVLGRLSLEATPIKNSCPYYLDPSYIPYLSIDILLLIKKDSKYKFVIIENKFGVNQQLGCFGERHIFLYNNIKCELGNKIELNSIIFSPYKFDDSALKNYFEDKLKKGH